jgi:hypothetical protein
MNLLNNINKDTEFQKVLRHFSNYNTYKIEKIYNIYNILNNFNFQNDIILIFNKIIKELNDDNTIDFLKTKDEAYLSKIFSYLQIIKNVKMYSKQNKQSNKNNINKKYIELEVNFWKYKLISKEKYDEIMNLICDINSKDDDIYKVYLYLWNKFLDPTKERIILRKPNYYVDYMLSDIPLLQNVNEEIINSYILNILSTNKIKNIEDKIDLNISSSELFFMLVNNYI